MHFRIHVAVIDLFLGCPTRCVGGASWLVRSTPDRAVRVGALSQDIAVWFWARHSTHSASLHPGGQMLEVSL